MHWLRRYKIEFQHKKIWDVQLCHFILGGQEEPYPSLNGTAEYYKLGQKLDKIQEYIDKKVDIDNIALEELIPYLEQDCILTRDCYCSQLDDPRLDESIHRLITLANIDLLILEEMEWNGLIYNIEQSNIEAASIRQELQSMDTVLSGIIGDYPINWNSGDHLSAVLYGGEIESQKRVENGTYKTGKKAGQQRFSILRERREFKRLVTPLRGTELEKENVWSTGEPILRQLRAYGKAAQIIDILLKRAKLEKLVSSYFEGIPKQLASMRWGTTIHGTLNQCVAATGRLSSSKPNLQNNPKTIDKLFMSRYVSTT